jgi:hypothetical protein
MLYKDVGKVLVVAVRKENSWLWCWENWDEERDAPDFEDECRPSNTELSLDSAG